MFIASTFLCQGKSAFLPPESKKNDRNIAWCKFWPDIDAVNHRVMIHHSASNDLNCSMIFEQDQLSECGGKAWKIPSVSSAAISRPASPKMSSSASAGPAGCVASSTFIRAWLLLPFIAMPSIIWTKQMLTWATVVCPMVGLTTKRLDKEWKTRGTINISLCLTPAWECGWIWLLVYGFMMISLE